MLVNIFLMITARCLCAIFRMAIDWNANFLALLLLSRSIETHKTADVERGENYLSFGTKRSKFRNESKIRSASFNNNGKYFLHFSTSRSLFVAAAEQFLWNVSRVALAADTIAVKNCFIKREANKYWFHQNCVGTLRRGRRQHHNNIISIVYWICVNIKSKPSLFVFHQTSWMFRSRSIRVTNSIFRSSVRVGALWKFDVRHRHEVIRRTPTAQRIIPRLFIMPIPCFCSLVS